jgi:tetratricopeptide (TPR) repeat protein
MADERDDSLAITRQATDAYESGDSKRALELLGEAIGKVPADETALRANLLLQKAAWLRESGYAGEATDALAVAARAVERLPLPGNETEWSWLRVEEGICAIQRGDLKSADALTAEAARLVEHSPARDVLRTDIYAAQATLLMDRGRLGEARDVLLTALSIDQRVGNRRSESNDLNMLGLVFKLLGDDTTAQDYLRKAFMMAYEAGLIREAVDAMSNLAGLMDDAGDHKGAALLFRQAAEAQAASGDLAGAACSAANQGVAAWLDGDLEAAATLLTRSHEMHLATGNPGHAVQDLINLSGIAAQRGQPETGLAYAEQAHAAATESGLVEVLWATEATVAKLRVRQLAASSERSGRVAALQEALAGYRRALDIIELLRAQVTRPEERELLLTDKETIYDEAIDVCLGLSQGESAFKLSERARMRSFLEALGSARLRQLAPDEPTAARREELTARLLSRQTPATDKPGLLKEIRLLRAQTMASNPVAAAITEAELPSLEQITAAIPAGTCVLEFFQFEHSVTGLAVLAHLLDHEGLKDAIGITVDEPLDTLIERFRDEIEAGDTGLGTGTTLFGLVRPFLRALATTSNLIIVPHRSLHRLPFGALWDPLAIEGAPRQYLKDRFHLATVPSASYLSYLAQPMTAPATYRPAVVLGNPTGDLKDAASEARRVAARLGVPPLLGPDATREAFLGAGAPLVLHVAGHGQYNKADPLLSGLLLADGPVTVEDLLDRGPAPAVLVLSGCVTGVSKRRPGDELTGLAQAALRSGTRSVVATLWETSDDSSAAFFEHFYDALLDGMTVSEAATSGRNALASGDDGYDQPVDWAPFVVIGDPHQRLVMPGAEASGPTGGQDDAGSAAGSRVARRDRLMAALAGRLNQVDQREDLMLALAPAAVEDARLLAELLDDADYADAVESRFLIGWLYWDRAVALGGEEREPNLRIATSRLYPGFVGGVGLEQLPRSLLPTLADAAEAFAEEQLAKAFSTTEVPVVTGVAELWRRIAVSTSDDHPHCGMRLSYLGIALRRLFECTGEPADLDEAIQACRGAVAVIPADDPNLAGQLANFGRVLQMRYELSGNATDLDEAVANLERAVSSGAGHPDLPQYKTSLCLVLRLRYEHGGAPADLDEALRLGRESVAATAVSHPEWPMYASHLANALIVRYEQSGLAADLDEAVLLGREALASAPAGHPNRTMCINNLGIALKLLAKREGSLADLDEAVRLGREVQASAPPGDAGWARTALNLGNALRIRYEKTGSPDDLNEAIGNLSQALAATLPGHFLRAGSAADLAKALALRYERTGEPTDLEEAIRLASESAQGGEA